MQRITRRGARADEGTWRASQYTSKTLRDFLARQEVPFTQSNGLSCYDNAVTESFFHTLKTESTAFEHFRTREEVHCSLFDYIEVFYINSGCTHLWGTTHLVRNYRE